MSDRECVEGFAAFLDDDDVTDAVTLATEQALARHEELGNAVDPEAVFFVAALSAAWSVAWDMGRKSLLASMGLDGLDEK